MKFKRINMLTIMFLVFTVSTATAQSEIPAARWVPDAHPWYGVKEAEEYAKILREQDKENMGGDDIAPEDDEDDEDRLYEQDRV